MKKQNNQRRQYFLLATIATIFLLGASASTFALENKTGNDFLTFDYLSSNTNQNLWFNSAPAKFDSTNIQSNLLAGNFKSAVEYPKPDFSDTEKWYEVVKYEYGDIAGGDTYLYFWAKPKVDPRPYNFYADFYNENGVANGPYSIHCEGACYGPDAVGKVLKWAIATPTETEMDSVKTVKIIRKKY